MNYLKCMKCGEITNQLQNMYLFANEYIRYTTKICVPCACELLSQCEWTMEERLSNGKYIEVE